MTETPKVIQQIIETKADDHVFIFIKDETLPAVSIDLTTHHGMRSVSIRINGVSIFNFSPDITTLNDSGEYGLSEQYQKDRPHFWHRFCPFCGQDLSVPEEMLSSRSHRCPPETKAIDAK